jgi:hypothetical protein
VAKSPGQHSIYVPTDEWETTKELAWRRHMSVSELIRALLQKDALDYARGSKPGGPLSRKVEDEDAEL